MQIHSKNKTWPTNSKNSNITKSLHTQIHINISPKKHDLSTQLLTSSECLLLVGNYLFKGDNRSTRKRCEIPSQLTITALERHHWRRFGVFNVNVEHIPYLVLVTLL